MATVKLELDTDSNQHNQDKLGSLSLKTAALAASKIGLVSSIALENTLLSQFLAGAGVSLQQISYGTADSKNYAKDAIKKIRDRHIADGCKVIATVGGSIAFDALNGDDPKNNQPFVSLVGFAPTSAFNDKLLGGVSMASYDSNPLRKTYLQGLAGGALYTPNNIYLYTNSNSFMHQSELGSWNSNTTAIESSVGDGRGNNDPAGFATDFTGGGITKAPLQANPTPPKGIIISDDPFFRAYRYNLISAANTWLAGDSQRFIIYPSQIYVNGRDPMGSNVVSPRSNQSTLFGPDLNLAYFLLGLLANYIAVNQSSNFLGFCSVSNSVLAIQ